MAQWHYVWKEWFRTTLEVGYDARCKVPYNIFEERLNYLPIQQAVLANPWDISSYTDPKVLKRIKQGFDLDLAVREKSREFGSGYAAPMFFRVFGYEEEYKYILPKYTHKYIDRRDAMNLVCKELKIKINYQTWNSRIHLGWNVYSACFQNFWNIINGKKYNNFREAKKDIPWLQKGMYDI